MTCPSHPARARLRARVAVWKSEICARQVVLAATRLALLMRKAGFDPGEPRIPAGCVGAGCWTGGGAEHEAITRRLDTPLKRGGLSYNEMRKLVAANNRSGQSDDLVMAIAYTESRFLPTAKYSDPAKTAAGLMGLTDPAVKDLRDLHEGYDRVDKFDPARNIAASSRYLRLRIKRTRGNLRQALAGYGPGIGYADRILEAAGRLNRAEDPLAVLRECLGK
jgi:hypothetical protein